MKYFTNLSLLSTLILILLFLCSITLKLKAQPINDLCENALGLTCNAEVPGTTINATYEEDIPFCSDRNYNSSVWYSFTPAMSDTVSISQDIFVRIEFEGEEDVAELSARILSGSCEGAFVAEDCSTFYSGGNLTIRDPVVGEKYYIMVSGVNGFEGDFTIRINKGGESCLPSNIDFYSLNVDCIESDPSTFYFDFDILDLGDNPSGFMVNNGDLPNITEPGTVTFGPFEGDEATITLIGIDQFNVIGPITVFAFCDCSGTGYDDIFTFSSGYSVASFADTLTLYKPTELLEGCDSTIWVTDIYSEEETILSTGDSFTFVPDSATTIYSVTNCEDCQRLIQEHEIGKGYVYTDCSSAEVTSYIDTPVGSGSNLFFTINAEIQDTASCDFLYWVTSISDPEGSIVSTETSVDIPLSMAGTYYGIVECEDFVCVEEVTLAVEDDNDIDPITILCPGVSAGEIDISSQYVCNANQPELTVTGQQVGSGTSLYYVFHDNPGLSVAGYTEATSIYGLSFENQAAPVSSFPCASTIYVTAFVTDAVSNLSDIDLTESCIEFSNTISFTYLCKTSIAISEQCNSGTYDLFVTITGGLPQVDNSATYSVFGSVYSGNIFHNQTFNIGPLSDGSGYNIEVIDDANCGAYANGSIQCDKLPVELLYFNGEATETGNLLKWATATEISNDYFTIESSFDGINFTKLTTQNGVGTSATSNNYNYLDRTAQNNITYYRLSQTDFDGTNRIVAYTNVTRGEQQDVVLLNTFPNPFEGELNLNIYSNTNNEAMLSLTNMLGSNLIELQLSLQQGSNVVELNTFNFPKGLYLLSLRSKKGNQYFKLLKD